jgi:pimeloyl-CoA synthetase
MNCSEMLPIQSEDYSFLERDQETRKKRLEECGFSWDVVDEVFRRYYKIDSMVDYDTMHRVESSEYDTILRTFEQVDQ